MADMEEHNLPLLTVKKKPQGPPLAGDGLVKYDQLLQLLKCVQCGSTVGGTAANPLIQCRKGHVNCQACKKKSASCKSCKQTFLQPEASILLEKVLSLVALKCRHEGCSEFLFVDKKLGHENFCPMRRLACRNAEKGCDGVYTSKDLSRHHKSCPFAAPK